METARKEQRSRVVMARCFLAAAAGSCASGATTWMQPVLFHHLIAERGMHEASAGLLITVELGAMSISSVAMARFVTRHRAQLFAIGGMVLAILASVLSLYAPTDAMLFLSRFVVGVGLGATIMVANIIAANFPDPDKTFARIGLVNLGFGAIAMGAYGWLQLLAHGATPFQFLMIVLLLLLPAMAALPRFRRFDHAGFDLMGNHGLRGTRSMRMRTALLAAITFMVVVASGVLWALYSVIGETSGLAPAEVNDAIAVSIAAGFVGTALPALVGSRAGRVLPFSGGLMVMAASIMVLSSGPTPGWFLIAVCGNVAAIYFLMPYLSGAAAMIDGGGNAAAYVGSTFFFGSAVSPLIAGVLISTVGIGLIGFATIAVALVSAGLFAYAERLARRVGGDADEAPLLSGVHLPVPGEHPGASYAESRVRAD